MIFAIVKALGCRVFSLGVKGVEVGAWSFGLRVQGLGSGV